MFGSRVDAKSSLDPDPKTRSFNISIATLAGYKQARIQPIPNVFAEIDLVN